MLDVKGDVVYFCIYCGVNLIFSFTCTVVYEDPRSLWLRQVSRITDAYQQYTQSNNRKHT